MGAGVTLLCCTWRQEGVIAAYDTPTYTLMFLTNAWAVLYLFAGAARRVGVGARISHACPRPLVSPAAQRWR